MTPSHLLAFALGLLVGSAIAWLAAHARRSRPPERLEFADLIADARRRCNVGPRRASRTEPPNPTGPRAQEKHRDGSNRELFDAY